MRGEILGLERRRRWRDEEKLGIVMSVGIDNVTVTQVARRHDVTRQQIYAWRHDLKKKGLLPPESGALFLAVDIPPAHRVPATLVGWCGRALKTLQPLIERIEADTRLAVFDRFKGPNPLGSR